MNACCRKVAGEGGREERKKREENMDHFSKRGNIIFMTGARVEKRKKLYIMEKGERQS